MPAHAYGAAPPSTAGRRHPVCRPPRRLVAGGARQLNPWKYLIHSNGIAVTHAARFDANANLSRTRFRDVDLDHSSVPDLRTCTACILLISPSPNSGEPAQWRHTIHRCISSLLDRRINQILAGREAACSACHETDIAAHSSGVPPTHWHSLNDHLHASAGNSSVIGVLISPGVIVLTSHSCRGEFLPNVFVSPSTAALDAHRPNCRHPSPYQQRRTVTMRP